MFISIYYKPLTTNYHIYIRGLKGPYSKKDFSPELSPSLMASCIRKAILNFDILITCFKIIKKT